MDNGFDCFTVPFKTLRLIPINPDPSCSNVTSAMAAENNCERGGRLRLTHARDQVSVSSADDVKNSDDDLMNSIATLLVYATLL